MGGLVKMCESNNNKRGVALLVFKEFQRAAREREREENKQVEDGIE